MVEETKSPIEDFDWDAYESGETTGEKSREELTRTYQWASSDARFFRYAGIPTLQYGPSTPSGIHAYNETAEVKDVVNITKVYLGTILDYLKEETPAI